MRYLLWFFFFTHAYPGYGQSSSVIEEKISRHLLNIKEMTKNDDTTFLFSTNIDKDSVVSENSALMNYLITVCEQNPQTMQMDFSSLAGLDFTIQMSEDKRVRMYSWFTGIRDTSTCPGIVSGYWHCNTLIQYQFGRKRTKVFILKDVSNYLSKPGVVRSLAHKKLLTVPRSGRKRNYYLVTSDKLTASCDRILEVKAYSIENSSLNDSLDLFVTADKKVSALIDTRYFRSLCLADFSYDKKTKRLNMPDCRERADFYKFDGYKFIYDKTAR